MPMYPYGYPSVPPPTSTYPGMPSSNPATTSAYPGFPPNASSYTPYGYPPMMPQQVTSTSQQQGQPGQAGQAQQQQQQHMGGSGLPQPPASMQGAGQQHGQQQPIAGADGRPLNALALAAATGLHEMERERAEREQSRPGMDVPGAAGGSASGTGSQPGSASNTPYGSFDQNAAAAAGYWPYAAAAAAAAAQKYAGTGYATSQHVQNASAQVTADLVAQQQAQQQQQAAQVAMANAAAMANNGSRRPSHAHGVHSHHLLSPSDDSASRHSHSHDPSHPTHHGSLARHQHRHAYAPYSLPASTDHSLANSPASSPGHSEQEAQQQQQQAYTASQQHSGLDANGRPVSHGGSASPFPPVQGGPGLVPGIGMASQPGHGQQHAIGELQQQLAYQLTPGASPVLGPLKGLTLMSAAGSRAPSQAPSRATSPAPVQLPPLRLPGQSESDVQPSSAGGGGGGGGDRSQPGSANASRAGTPDATIEAQKHAFAAGNHHGTAQQHRASHRNHPYGRSQPGSPVNGQSQAGSNGARTAEGTPSAPNSRPTSPNQRTPAFASMTSMTSQAHAQLVADKMAAMNARQQQYEQQHSV